MQELSEWLKNNTGENLAGNIADAVARAKLDTLAENTRALVGTRGGINTDEKFIEYHAYEEDLMDLLISYIPLLLEKEAFFKDVFYS